MAGDPRKPVGISRQHRTVLIAHVFGDRRTEMRLQPDGSIPPAQRRGGLLRNEAAARHRVFAVKCDAFEVGHQIAGHNGRIRPAAIGA